MDTDLKRGTQQCWPRLLLLHLPPLLSTLSPCSRYWVQELCCAGCARPPSVREKGRNLDEGSMGSRTKHIPDALRHKHKGCCVCAPNHRPRHSVRSCLLLALQVFGVDVSSLSASSHVPPAKMQSRRHPSGSRLSSKSSLGLSGNMSPALESPSGYSLSSLGMASPLRPASKLLAASKDMVLRVL